MAEPEVAALVLRQLARFERELFQKESDRLPSARRRRGGVEEVLQRQERPQLAAQESGHLLLCFRQKRGGNLRRVDRARRFRALRFRALLGRPRGVR